MITFEDVHKTYKSGVEALKGISFEIEDGEFVFIIGKSGSGKSTLMKCITCEEEPTEGDVLIDGFSIAGMSRALVPVLRRHIGMVYQDFRLIESKTVFENIAFAGEIIGIPKKNLNQIVQFMLNLVGLRDKADAYPKELSGGEQQRIAIARAMVNNPKIMVADEPTGNLDPETSENIMALLQEINRSGTTVVVCTHDSNLVDRMKKRVIEIDGGLIARDQKDSKYTEEAKPVVKSVPENVSPVAFGDDPAFSHDGEYSDSFDDEGYSADSVPAQPAFFFGDTPEGTMVMPAVPAPESKPEPVTEPISEVVSESVSETEPVVEPAPAPEAESDSIEKPELNSEDDAEGEAVKEEEVKLDVTFGDEKEETETQDEENSEDESDPINSDDDSWLKEISLEDSDIDLDIQEDDE